MAESDHFFTTACSGIRTKALIPTYCLKNTFKEGILGLVVEFSSGTFFAPLTA
jgi:hypothetical protein